MKKAQFQYLLEFASWASDSISEGCPSRVRPFMKVLVYLCTLLFMLVLIPIMIPYSLLFWLLERIKKPKISSFMKLETELTSLWYSESSFVALKKLRTIRQQLIANEIDGLLKGIHITPYGTFKWGEYLQVLWLLYHYEVSHRHWNEANSVCDEVFEMFGGEDKRFMKVMRQVTHINEWIVNKAKMLEKMEGTTPAQHYLLQYLDPEQSDNPVNIYFHELRKASGVPFSNETGEETQEIQTQSNMEEIQENTQNTSTTPSQRTNIVELPRQSDQTSKEVSE